MLTSFNKLKKYLIYLFACGFVSYYRLQQIFTLEDGVVGLLDFKLKEIKR
jgi:hypothetical protein